MVQLRKYELWLEPRERLDEGLLVQHDGSGIEPRRRILSDGLSYGATLRRSAS
jgi:hypothetical protein